MNWLPQDRAAWKRDGKRIGAWTLSVGAHAVLLMALIVAWHMPPVAAAMRPIAVSFAEPLLPPKPRPPPHPKTAPAARRPAAARIAARSVPAPPAPEPLPVAPAKTTNAGQGVELSGSEIAGAAEAGEGAPGGGCDMARRVQAALRRDPIVRAAVAQNAFAQGGGRAIMVWNGDWVQSGGEDGKGLAAVREAITWEVAFSPPACKVQPMRGLVLLSLNSASARFALGAGAWRWSDLLGLRR